MGLSLGGIGKGPSKLAFGFKSAQNKAKPIAAFAAEDSDDEGEVTREAKKQRTTERGGPRPPADPEVLRAADKLAGFVAANGRSFEDVTRERNPDSSVFRFLFDKSSADYQYYDSRVRALQAGTSSEKVESKPAAQHYTSAPGQHASLHSSEAARSAGLVATAESERRAAQRALRDGDSMAAMEAFAKIAAQREKEAPPVDPEESGQVIPHLNETGFDRRKQMAVYKSDGTRAHHMSDYIPQEELAKFLAKSGDKTAAEAIENQQKIGGSNIGHKLLSKMGWKEGEGLGAKGSGISAPVGATGAAGYSTLGLGAAEVGAPAEGADSFEVYRARMMLGYKHRPNPNGNPRKAYNN